MANKPSKALSSAGIVGIMLAIMESVAGTPWAFEISHQNFNGDLETVEYATVSATPAMRRWIGGRKAQTLFAQSITLKGEDYEDTLVDKIKNWVYDRTGLLRKRLANFIGMSVKHWNKLASEALELGETTLTYDGANFFSASHSTGSSGTIKNLVTSSTVAALDVVSTSSVTVAEAANIIYGLYQHFLTFKDDQGEPIHEDLEGVMIMVPPIMSAAFKQAIVSTVIVDGSTSRSNPLVGSDFTVRIVSNARLTSNTVLYAFALNGDPALILQQRGDVEPSAKAEGSDFAHDTDQWEFGIKAERAAGLFCWQAAIKATIS